MHTPPPGWNTITGLLALCPLMLGEAREAAAAIDVDQFQEALVAGIPAIDSPGETWGAAWGDYDGDGRPDLWLGKHQFTPSALLRNNGDGSFTDVIDSDVVDAAVHYNDDTHGAVWADFDNDGDDDLIEVCGAGAGAGAGSGPISNEWRNNLYVNLGGILVEDAAGFAIEHPRARSRTPLWVDYDADGALDLVIAALQTIPEQYPSALFHQGSTSFSETGGVAGFTPGSCQNAMLAHLGPNREPAVVCGDTSSIQAIYDISSDPFTDLRPTLGNALFSAFPYDLAIADFNGDLLLDVFAGMTPPNPSMAVRTNNDRIHAFLSPGAQEKGLSFTAPGPVTLDLGYPTARSDVFLGAAGAHAPEGSDQGLLGPDRYPHHIQLTLEASDPTYQGMVANRTAGVYIGRVSGRWEIRAVNAGVDLDLSAQANGISTAQPIGAVNTTQGNAQVPGLYLMSAPGALLAQTTGAAFPFDPASAVQTYARSVVAADLDNDMDVDVYIGASGRVANVPNLLLDNQGNGTFRVVPNTGGAAGSLLGRTDSVTLVDYDQDGFMDLFVTQGNFPAPFSYVADQQLFRNQGNDNRWVLIDLEGVASNRDGVGALVYATTADGATQVREQSNGVHRYAQSYRQIHFGLAQHTAVDLEVHWPSGVVDHFPGRAAGMRHHLVEGAGTLAYFLSADDPSVTEGDGQVVFTLTLQPTPGPGEEVAVAYQTTDGTALAGGDYTQTAGTVRFMAGERQRTVSVPIIDDGIPEGVETFSLSLSGADMDPLVATATLLDEDHEPDCGAPSFDRATESALFVWNDCGTGNWHLRVTAGGQALSYQGSLTSSSPLAGVTGFSLEAGDVLPPPSFTFNVAGSGQDGVDFGLPAGAETCLTLDTPGVPVIAGANRVVVANLLRLPDFGTCDGGGPAPACGAPSYDTAMEYGVFLWNDCGTSQWHIRVTAGGQALSYSGVVSSGEDFAGLSGFSIEGSDVLIPDPFAIPTPGPIAFELNVGGSGHDGIDFAVAPGADGCIVLAPPPGTRVFAGADRVEVGDSVGLSTYGPCGP